MSIKVLAPERLVKQPGESRSYAMDFANLLATGETLSAVVGSAAVSPVTVPPLTITGEAVTTTTATFRAASGLVDTVYHIEIQVTTSGSNTIEGDGILHCKDD